MGTLNFLITLSSREMRGNHSQSVWKDTICVSTLSFQRQHCEKNKNKKGSRLSWRMVQKVKSLPGHDRFHRLAVRTGGNTQTLIFFLIDFLSLFSLWGMCVHKMWTFCTGVKPEADIGEASRWFWGVSVRLSVDERQWFKIVISNVLVWGSQKKTFTRIKSQTHRVGCSICFRVHRKHRCIFHILITNIKLVHTRAILTDCKKQIS